MRRVRWICLSCIAAMLLATACQPIQRPPAQESSPAAQTAQAGQPSLVGRWEGKIEVAGIELAIVVDFAADGDTYSATLDIPQQGAVDLPVAAIQAAFPAVAFQILSGPQTAFFDGELSGDDTISGAFRQGGAEGVFTLNRVVDAPPSIAGTASLYVDPAGRFSAPIPAGWNVNEGNGFVTFTDPDDSLRIHALVMETTDVSAAIAEAWRMVDPAFSYPVSEELEPPSDEGVERTVVVNYRIGSDVHFIQALGQLYDGASYVLLFDLELEGLQRRAAQLNTIITGFKILGKEKTDLTDIQPVTFDEKIARQWEEFIARAMDEFEIPGAAAAVVQNGEVVYARGFGFADSVTKTPMTTGTHMMIGSVGKSITTLLMATLVDAGLMDWDTRAVDIYPDFAVADPTLSEQITMRNLVCACTGVPRRDAELIFNASELSATDIISSLRTFEFFTDFGETFQYSNQMVATAGYLAGVAAGGEISDPYAAYARALEEQVLTPIGMNDTTLDMAAVVSRGVYATPHAMDLSFTYRPISLEVESLLTPVAPAGAHWSTLDDMARYMILQLNNGVAPGGVRVVSEENLQVTRMPQVAVSAGTSYGLGWLVGDYKGQPFIHHGGNTIGFTSNFAFLPDANLGVIVLANAQGANAFTDATSTRLLELLFDLPSQVEPNLNFMTEQMAKQRQETAAKMSGAVDVEAVSPWLGEYDEPALGRISLFLEENELMLDAGEFRTRVRPYKDEDVAFDGYVFFDPPLPGVTLRLARDDSGSPTIVIGQGLAEYTFIRHN